MANIRKLYEADQTTQLMPQTHERAVVDNNGTTAETKFQMITELVNQKQMEIGAVPSDLTPTAGSTNWVPSGGVYSTIKNERLSVNFSALTLQNGYPHAQYGYWKVDSTTRTHYVIERMENANKVSITSGNDSAYISFLKSYSTPVNNAAVPYCNNTRGFVLPSGTTTVLDIPNDCKYIVAMNQNASSIYKPSAIAQYRDYTNLLKTESVNIDFSVLAVSDYWVGADGAASTKSGSKHYVISIDDMDYVRIKASTTYDRVIFTWATAISNNSWTLLTQERFYVNAGDTETFKIPTGAKYIIVGKLTGFSGDPDFTPQSLILLEESEVLKEKAFYLAQDMDFSINFANYETLQGWIGGGAGVNDGDYVHVNLGASHYAIPVQGESCTITAGANNAVFVFASDINGYLWTKASDGRTVLPAGETMTYEVPSNATHIIVGYKSMVNEVDNTPSSLVFHQNVRNLIISMNNKLNQVGKDVEKEERWRIMTYNMGCLNGGTGQPTSSITTAQYDSKKEVYYDLLNQFDANIIGCEEYPILFSPNATGHSTETTSEILFHDFWSKYINLTTTDNGKEFYQAINGKEPIVDFEHVAWEHPSLVGSYYTYGVWKLKGIDVKVVVVHFRFDRNDLTDATLQSAQVTQLVNTFANDSHVIIMGDFNIPSLSVLSPFTTAGYALSNGGAFGEFQTYTNNDGFATKCLDNIIVKGFDIQNVSMVLTQTNVTDFSMSDHYPLLATIKLKE